MNKAKLKACWNNKPLGDHKMAPQPLSPTRQSLPHARRPAKRVTVCGPVLRSWPFGRIHPQPLSPTARRWVLCLRLKPLVVGVGPLLLGIAMARWNRPNMDFNWLLNIAITFCVILIQTATHFFNDALDFLKGADGSERQGPRRAVQRGLISPSSLIKVAIGCLFLATLIGIYLVKQGGWPILLVGFLSLFLAYCYTGGPWPLAYTGLADIFVVLFFGVLPVGLVFYLNTGYFSGTAWVGGLLCGFLALSLLVVNNLRDRETDRRAGKKTLVVRFGPLFGLWEGGVALLFPYLIGFWWFIKGLWLTGFWLFLLLAFAVYIQYRLQSALKHSIALGDNQADKPYLEEKSLFSGVFSAICVHYTCFVCLLSLSFWLTTWP